MSSGVRAIVKPVAALAFVAGLLAMTGLFAAWLVEAGATALSSPMLERWAEALPGRLREVTADADEFTKWLGWAAGVTTVGGVLLAAVGGGLRIARRSLSQHALSTVITVTSVGLAAGLLLTVLSVQTQTQQTFESASGNFDAVLGTRSSELQLVLNSVYHLEQPPGNLPWTVYQEITAHPGVKLALPIAVGDNYRGFRVVGVDPRLFTEHEIDDQGTTLSIREGGRVFDPARREAVVGSFAARQLGLSVGDTFHTYHGLTFNESERHESDRFLVVGILETTNTPMDRVLWIPLEGYFRMSGHALQGSGETYIPQAGQTIPDEHKEVSAVLLTFHSSTVGRRLVQTVNQQGTVATVAFPVSRVVAQLFDRLGWVSRVLQLVAYLVVLVAAGSILASVYNTMNERRREFAILRALGARKRTVFGAIVLESAAIALLGTVVGYAIYGLLMTATTTVLRMQVGVVLDVTAWHPALVLTPIGMTVLGALAGFVPAFKAYGTDVAANLVPQS